MLVSASFLSRDLILSDRGHHKVPFFYFYHCFSRIHSFQSGNVYQGGGARNSAEAELTAEEWKFMAEQMGESCSEFGEYFDYHDDVDDPEMSPDIQAAFEEFIKSQK